MKYKRMFVLEVNDLISIRKVDGEACMHRDNLRKYYPGLDLTGKDKINYEPESNLFRDDSYPGGVMPEADYQQYEDVIDAIDQIKSDHGDHYYGLTLDNAKTLKRRTLKAEGKNIFEEKHDYFTVVQYVVDASADKVQILADYKTIRDYFILKRNEVNACSDIACVKAVTATWPEI